MASITSMQLLLVAVVFTAVFGLGLAVTWLLSPDAAQVRVRQFAAEGPAIEASPGVPRWTERVVRLTGPLARLSVPKEGWEHSPLRIHFMNAGFRGPAAPAIYFAMKTVLAIGFPVAAFVALSVTAANVTPPMLMTALLLAGAVGYYLPNGVLGHIVRRRQRDLLEAFPDALDLMTVCVEAGLGLDAALVRVASEMQLSSPVLSEELQLVNLELRAGATKERALRNLALRTGVEDVDALVAMLVQSERFGTSVAESLRVQSDALRTRRRLRAEEAAAKIPLKLLFPLVFCIFPAMLVVLLGPAAIRVVRLFIPIVQGMQ